jgi:hypothetical protein
MYLLQSSIIFAVRRLQHTLALDAEWLPDRNDWSRPGLCGEGK